MNCKIKETQRKPSHRKNVGSRIGKGFGIISEKIRQKKFLSQT